LFKEVRQLGHISQQKSIRQGEVVVDRWNSFVVQDRTKIASGSFYKAYLVKGFIQKGDQEIQATFVEKRFTIGARLRNIFRPLSVVSREQQILNDFEIWQHCRRAGLPTLNTYRIDRRKKAVYCTSLIKLDDRGEGIIYVSANNNIPRQFPYQKKVRITKKDVKSLISELANIAGTASSIGLRLSADCLFYGLKLPELRVMTNVGKIADFNYYLEIHPRQKNQIGFQNFLNLRAGLEGFLKTYSSDYDKSKGIKNQLLKEIRTKEQFLCADGQVISWQDYSFEKNGEVVFGAMYINMNPDSSLEDIQKAKKITEKNQHITFNLTFVSPEIKNKIVSWPGNLIDNSKEVEYLNLGEIYGNFLCCNATRINAPLLNRAKAIVIAIRDGGVDITIANKSIPISRIGVFNFTNTAS